MNKFKALPNFSNIEQLNTFVEQLEGEEIKDYLFSAFWRICIVKENQEYLNRKIESLQKELLYANAILASENFNKNI